MDINTVILTGNLTADPELHSSGNGPFAKLRLASQRSKASRETSQRRPNLNAPGRSPRLACLYAVSVQMPSSHAASGMDSVDRG